MHFVYVATSEQACARFIQAFQASHCQDALGLGSLGQSEQRQGQEQRLGEGKGQRCKGKEGEEAEREEVERRRDHCSQAAAIGRSQEEAGGETAEGQTEGAGGGRKEASEETGRGGSRRRGDLGGDGNLLHSLKHDLEADPQGHELMRRDLEHRAARGREEERMKKMEELADDNGNEQAAEVAVAQLAALNGHEQVAELLLSQTLGSMADGSSTPLHAAAANGQVNADNQEQADVTMAGFKGFGPVSQQGGTTPLLGAAFNGLEQLGRQCGTPLQVAAFNGNEQLAKQEPLQVAAFNGIEQLAKDNASPLQVAASNGNEKLASLQADGDTPLHVTVNGQEQLAETGVSHTSRLSAKPLGGPSLGPPVAQALPVYEAGCGAAPHTEEFHTCPQLEEKEDERLAEEQETANGAECTSKENAETMDSKSDSGQQQKTQKPWTVRATNTTEKDEDEEGDESEEAEEESEEDAGFDNDHAESENEEELIEDAGLDKDHAESQNEEELIDTDGFFATEAADLDPIDKAMGMSCHSFSIATPPAVPEWQPAQTKKQKQKDKKQKQKQAREAAEKEQQLGEKQKDCEPDKQSWAARLLAAWQQELKDDPSKATPEVLADLKRLKKNVESEMKPD